MCQEQMTLCSLRLFHGKVHQQAAIFLPVVPELGPGNVLGRVVAVVGLAGL